MSRKLIAAIGIDSGQLILGDPCNLHTTLDAAREGVLGERQRADALRDRLETASAEAQEAQERVEALERADAARRAQGRLRRAWAAWRGE
jgi:hypothetical protein